MPIEKRFVRECDGGLPWTEAEYYRRKAREQCDEDLQVEEDAPISASADGTGAFVQAWIWINK